MDPRNFDTKNVKQYTKGGKKEKVRGMSMRGTALIRNKSTVIEDTVVFLESEIMSFKDISNLFSYFNQLFFANLKMTVVILLIVIF